MNKKRGVFFSTDALVALSIVFFVVLIAFPIVNNSNRETYVNRDVIVSLSSLKVSEADSPYLQSLIAQGIIEESNKSVLQQIGELYVTNTTLAQELSNELLADLDENSNVGIWFGNNLVASKNITSYENARNIKVSNQIITGLKEGAGVNGFSARSYVSNSLQSKYVYFGGYTGDGNITINVDYEGNISLAEIEITINKNFSLYVNDNFEGVYPASTSDFIPQKYSIPVDNFISGSNVIELKGDMLYVTGGYIKITYDSSGTYEQTTRYNFPGIHGIINLYDGISIPSQLTSMNILLHYNSSYNTFLSIGNTTVLNATSSGDTSQIISNTELQNLLDYDLLSNKTIPIRFGIENISFSGNLSGEADVVLITDTSGSMDWRLDSDSSGTARNCNDPLLTSPSTKRISLAKCIDKDFVATILGGSGNRVGLVGFAASASNYVSLTTDSALLNSTIDAYVANGGTCVSCAINRAQSILEASGNSSRKKYIIVMTDGVTNYRSTPICYNAEGLAVSNSTTKAMQVGQDGSFIEYQSDWSALSQITSSDIFSVDMYNQTLGFAVGSSYKIYSWSGSTWSEQQDLGSQTLYDVDVYSPSLGFAVGDSGKIARWSGSSWSEQQDLGSFTMNAVSILNDSWSFAVGDSGRIYSWSGSTWTQYQDLGSNDLYGVSVWNNTLGFAVGSSGKVYRWSGSSWSEQQDLGSMTLTDVFILNGTQAFATGSNGRIYSWSGSSWTSVYAGSDDLNSISIVNSTLGFAVGSSTEGIIKWSGSSWSQEFPSYLYSGNNTNGITCNDGDTCSLTQTIPMLNTNYSACKAREAVNATIDAVGFGPITTCSLATRTLQAISSCGNGSYYSSTNATLLQQYYQAIAENILEFSYSEQIAQASGESSTTLYPDSYIEMTYALPNQPYGLVLTLESQFTNSSTGNFSIPENSTIIEATAISYSGPRWTTLVRANNKVIYNLSSYGKDYILLGDPHAFIIPLETINSTSSNNISITTGVGLLNTSSGSQYNKIIYKIIRNISSYSPISLKAEGCVWNLQFDDDTNATINVPSSYSGTNICQYTETQQVFDINDAIQYATYNIIRNLDLNGNYKVDIKIVSQNLQIVSSEIQGIPFTWATEVQVRTWD